MRGAHAALVAALAVARTGAARAEDGRLGTPGFVIGVDRLLPLLTYQSIQTTNAGNSQTQSRLSVGLLGNAPPYVFGSFYDLPRLGFDWVPIRNVTIGGDAWVYTDLTVSDNPPQPSPPPGGPYPLATSSSPAPPKATYWGVAPRVGYVIRLGEKLSVWPRAGVEYHHVSLSGDAYGTVTIAEQFALDLEAMLVYSPWDHVGFTVGPTADIPISGSERVESASTFGTPALSSTEPQLGMLQVGLSASMLCYF